MHISYKWMRFSEQCEIYCRNSTYSLFIRNKSTNILENTMIYTHLCKITIDAVCLNLVLYRNDCSRRFH